MIVQCKEEDVEKNGYWHTDRQTDTQTDSHATQWPSPVHCTGLGKKWNILANYLDLLISKAESSKLIKSVCLNFSLKNPSTPIHYRSTILRDSLQIQICLLTFECVVYIEIILWDIFFT